MTYSRLLTLALLLTSFAFLAACQEEEDAGLLSKASEDVIKYEAIYPEKSEFIAKTVLSSDEKTTEILGQESQLFYYVGRRPKGCPVNIGPLCYPDLEFFLGGAMGVDPTRFNYKEFDGQIIDPKTGSVVAYLTDISEHPETGAVSLIYSINEKFEIVSDQLQVTFSPLYEADKSIERLAFEGEVPSGIVDSLR